MLRVRVPYHIPVRPTLHSRSLTDRVVAYSQRLPGVTTTFSTDYLVQFGQLVDHVAVILHHLMQLIRPELTLHIDHICALSREWHRVVGEVQLMVVVHFVRVEVVVEHPYLTLGIEAEGYGKGT